MRDETRIRVRFLSSLGPLRLSLDFGFAFLDSSPIFLGLTLMFWRFYLPNCFFRLFLLFQFFATL